MAVALVWQLVSPVKQNVKGVEETAQVVLFRTGHDRLRMKVGKYLYFSGSVWNAKHMFLFHVEKNVVKQKSRFRTQRRVSDVWL